MEDQTHQGWAEVAAVQEPDLASTQYACQAEVGKRWKAEGFCQERKVNDTIVVLGVTTSSRHQELVRILEWLEILCISRTEVRQTCVQWMNTILSLQKGSCRETKTPAYEKGLSLRKRNAA